MNSYVFIKFKNIKSEKLIYKLHVNNIIVDDVEMQNNDVIIRIKEEEIKKIKKNIKTIDYEIIKYTGKNNIKHLIKKNIYVIISFFVGIILVMISSNLIVDINIIHEDEEIVDIINEELDNYGIEKFSFAKSYEALNNIKKEIKEKHLDRIDWLEIEKKGMKYIIKVEERIINKEKDEKSYCHVYANKDSLIKNYVIYKGESNIVVNDYVKKGDLLISGDIHLNDEIVNKVCAQGKVYGEVWYTVKMKVPFNYYVNKKTGKKRYNFIINFKNKDHQVFNNRLKYYISKKEEIFNLLGIKIYLKTDEEINKIKKSYNEKEAIEFALNNAKEKINLKLKDDEKIISEKVLQKEINNSTIDIEIFIITNEQIGNSKVIMEENNGL